MVYTVRPMTENDISQVSRIERDAFPPPWPATNFKRELRYNTLSHYFVACEDALERKDATAKINSSGSSKKSLNDRIKAFINRMLANQTLEASQDEKVLGFAGLWFMADEAHLANIAVRLDRRREGIGELLLIAVIDLAIERQARFFTLEVRASNKEAQALYGKFGLIEVGTRRGYYMDNKEDAVIMTADNITSQSYIDGIRQLKQAHAA
ncbi:MAG: ribosomal-protein-alanine N-acetyltransferase [Chloroflexi bacterium]|nr:ribosomal-protein-alanine N-acetyltransferase [Chloroflexota bacterium]